MPSRLSFLSLWGVVLTLAMLIATPTLAAPPYPAGVWYYRPTSPHVRPTIPAVIDLHRHSGPLAPAPHSPSTEGHPTTSQDSSDDTAWAPTTPEGCARARTFCYKVLSFDSDALARCPAEELGPELCGPAKGFRTLGAWCTRFLEAKDVCRKGALSTAEGPETLVSEGTRPNANEDL